MRKSKAVVTVDPAKRHGDIVKLCGWDDDIDVATLNKPQRKKYLLLGLARGATMEEIGARFHLPADQVPGMIMGLLGEKSVNRLIANQQLMCRAVAASMAPKMMTEMQKELAVASGKGKVELFKHLAALLQLTSPELVVNNNTMVASFTPAPEVLSRYGPNLERLLGRKITRVARTGEDHHQLAKEVSPPSGD